MSKTLFFSRVWGTLRGATGERESPRSAGRNGRREALLGGATLLGGAALPGLVGCAAEGEPLPTGDVRARLKKANVDIGIVGAGIAGLACAYELKRYGSRPPCTRRAHGSAAACSRWEGRTAAPSIGRAK